MNERIDIDGEGHIHGTLLSKDCLQRRIDIAGLGLPDTSWTPVDYTAWEITFDEGTSKPVSVYIKRGMESGLDFDACNDAFHIGKMLRKNGKFDAEHDAIYWYRDIGNLSGSAGYLWLRDGRMHRIWGLVRS